MTIEIAHERLEWLRRAAADGTVHTVRVSWPDRLGGWRGKRVPVDDFLADPDRRIGFCDGMIVVDVGCAIIQETPFSNFETGYPDMYLRPDVGTLRPACWADGEAFVLGELQSHHGERLAVAPRNVLRAVLARLAQSGVGVRASLTLSGRLMRSPRESVALLPGGLGRGEPGKGVLRAAAEALLASGVPVASLDARRDGSFRLGLEALEAGEAADLAFVAKAAVKEVALQQGLNAVFMTVVPGAGRPAQLEIDLELDGPASPAPEPSALLRAIADVRALLQPSITAFKAGPPGEPTIERRASCVAIGSLRASSEADPTTALAAVLAAAAVAAGAPTSTAPVASARTLDEAADRLVEAPWVADWLGSALIDNALPLLRHETRSFAAAVTDWEIERYWMQS